jgi:RimJ/RimL family protein N-acetyltransferase
MSMIPTPTFETPRLLLREICAADIPAYEKQFIDYEVVKYLTAQVPWPYPAGGIKDYLEQQIFPVLGKSRWSWAINLKEDPDQLIGMIELFIPGSPQHRGLWLGRSFWGQGYMTEAVAPVNDFAFNELRLKRLIFDNAVTNRRSARIKEKTGARFLERKPASFVDPTVTEIEYYELTKADWKRVQASG